MSGNPFRRGPSAARLPDASEDRATAPQQATTAKGKNKKPKRVQIISPDSSPTDYRRRPRRASDGGTGSPPPERLEPDSDDDSDESSSVSADEDLEKALINTRRNSGSDPLSPPIPPISTAGPSQNPFAKSGISGGGAPQVSFGIPASQTRPRIVEDESIGPTEKPRSAGRPVMDVDAFKNMLLTGTTTSTAVASQSGAKVQDSGSGTDTSSISKHSLFEPPPGSVAESPRTSFDDRISEEDVYDDDNEDASLMGPNRSQDIAPALPPKQGKSKAKGPQTVSFADFDETIPSPVFERSSPVTPRSQHNAFFATMTQDWSGSDLNKPLPAPPLEISTTDISNESQPSPSTPVQGRSADTMQIPSLDASPTPKKPAPPPPAARRQAQPAPAPPAPRNRARSTSSLDAASVTEQEEGEVVTPVTSPAAKRAATLPPPPPPSRRAQNTTIAQPSPPVESPPTPSIPETAPIYNTKAPMPLPPPRRHASTTGKSLTRTPSNSSRQSLPRNESSSTSLPTQGNLNAPPAPPPRRGVGSNRNSIDGHRRASNQSFGSQRSGSISSMQNDGVTISSSKEQTSKEPPRDILADMTAFQQEIDALRARAFKND